MDMLEKFLNFAEQSPTAFHAAANLAALLEENGFAEL
jgi:aspartyl aminopeptidase